MLRPRKQKKVLETHHSGAGYHPRGGTLPAGIPPLPPDIEDMTERATVPPLSPSWRWEVWVFFPKSKEIFPPAQAPTRRGDRLCPHSAWWLLWPPTGPWSPESGSLADRVALAPQRPPPECPGPKALSLATCSRCSQAQWLSVPREEEFQGHQRAMP